MTNEFSEIRFKKSLLKILICSAIYLIGFAIFFSMGFSSKVGLPWVAWLATSMFAFLSVWSLSIPFRQYGLVISDKGVTFCDQFYAWRDIDGIGRVWGYELIVDTTLIWLNVVDRKANILPNSRNGIERKRVIIPPLVFNASQEKIEDELQRFCKKFSEPELK